VVDFENQASKVLVSELLMSKLQITSF